MTNNIGNNSINNNLDIYPKLSDGETSVIFAENALHVFSPSYEEPVVLNMSYIRRNYYLTNMTTENMYSHLVPLIRSWEVSNGKQ